MASSTKSQRPVRTLTTLAVLIILAIGGLAAGVRWSDASWTPKLALDLEGGTQIILTPKTTDGSTITDQDISEAINIIRQRVDASGVAEAEITSQGGQNIVVALPGTPDQATLDLVRRSAQMNFRPVLAYDSALSSLVEDEPSDGATDEPTDGSTDEPTTDATDEPTADATEEPAQGEGSTEGESRVRAETATPSGDATETEDATETADATSEDEEAPAADPSDPSDLAQITDAVAKQFEELDCVDPANRAGGSSGAENEVLVTCSTDGLFKYILGPVEIPGRMIDTASSGLRQLANGAVSNEWAVNMEFTKEGADRFRATTARLAQQYQASLLGEEVAPNLFAMVLDGLVISAPSVENEIPDGRAEVTGSFTQKSAADLANQLNFGALPLDFVVQSESEISATLGSEQLEKGLIAGLIGLLLVVVYSLVQYRTLGLVTVASLILATILTYIVIALLSWTQGYRLSLPGVTGLVVAIGITADSFIVYFERIRDELRDGRALMGAVDKGWSRAKRTILASDAVNFLAAVVLYFLAVGGVRGFAFTLGLTTVIDLIVVFFFTHPLMTILAKTKFFASGHPASGLDPRQLGVDRPRYAGRGRVTGMSSTTTRSAEPALVGADTAGDDGRRLTLAERKAAAARAAADAEAEAPPATTDAEAGDDEETR
ncbi:preprotein translocase subunit SecD [Flavimobilis soli]|uniref:Protein translocase subunit SecD n=1 Tax=Flavimobilis soli TaxID=442709 RepID=A0A2A9EBS1_9MICO|nr:preprotein translocase subunit SecD [Flavimobilis soli]